MLLSATLSWRVFGGPAVGFSGTCRFLVSPYWNAPPTDNNMLKCEAGYMRRFPNAAANRHAAANHPPADASPPVAVNPPAAANPPATV